MSNVKPGELWPKRNRYTRSVATVGTTAYGSQACEDRTPANTFARLAAIASSVGAAMVVTFPREGDPFTIYTLKGDDGDSVDRAVSVAVDFTAGKKLGHATEYRVSVRGKKGTTLERLLDVEGMVRACL